MHFVVGPPKALYPCILNRTIGLVEIRDTTQIEMDIPVEKRFRQTRYTYTRFMMGIKLFYADRRRWRAGAYDHLHLKQNSAIHLRYTI